MGVLEELNQAQPSTIEVAPSEIQFWNWNSETGKLSIDALEVITLLEALGFRRLNEGMDYRYVRVVRGSVLQETNRTFIIDAFFEHLDKMDEELEPGLSRRKLKKKIVDSMAIVFKEDKLLLLGSGVGGVNSFQKDSPEKKYMFFKNGFLEISAKEKKFMPYTDLQGSVWEDQIIPHEWIPTAQYKSSPFYKFMHFVSGQDKKRLGEFMIWTGYYLHHPADGKRRALILTDSSMSSNLEANGRTGKSLYCKGLGFALSVDPSMDGIFMDVSARDFDPNYKFKYQSATTKTKVIILNDLKPHFNLETLYNDITEGIAVNQKGLAPFRINPKVLLTTNRTVSNEGQSSKDRFQEFEFSDYFSPERTPETEFGHWFFRDWTPGQWGQFFALMAQCVQDWLAAGALPRPASINLNARKLIEQTSKDFADWFEDKKFDFAIHYDRVKDQGQYYHKGELYNDLVTTYTDFQSGRSKLSMKKFTLWISKYTKYSDTFAPFDDKRDSYRSNKDFYICFRKAK